MWVVGALVDGMRWCGVVWGGVRTLPLQCCRCLRLPSGGGPPSEGLGLADLLLFRLCMRGGDVVGGGWVMWWMVSGWVVPRLFPP